MAKPEERVIQIFKRRLTKFAETRGYTLHVDKPPAGMFNNSGRSDLFIDLGPFHFRCEMKAKNGKLSALQKLYMTLRQEQMPLTCHVIIGEEGVEQWMRDLPQLIEDYKIWASQIE